MKKRKPREHRVQLQGHALRRAEGGRAPVQAGTTRWGRGAEDAGQGPACSSPGNQATW